MGSEDERSETSGDGFDTVPGVVKTGGKLKGHRLIFLVVGRLYRPVYINAQRCRLGAVDGIDLKKKKLLGCRDQIPTQGTKG